MPLLWISLSFLLGLTLHQVSSFLIPAILSTLATLYFLIQIVPYSWIMRFSWLQKLRIEEKIYFTPQTPTAPRPNYPKQVLIPTMIIFTFLGMLLSHFSLPNGAENQLATYNDQYKSVRLIGVLDSLPHETENANSVFVKIQEICLPSQPCQVVKGRAYVVVNRTLDFSYGDQVAITGSLTSPEDYESFSEINYLKSKHVFSKIAFPSIYLIETGHGNPLKSALYSLREKAVTQVFRLYPQPVSSLLAGILFGEEDQIPQSVETAFRNTSTSHIIVISGFNITILAALCLNLLRRFLNKWQSTLITALILIAYTILVGGDAAVSRAAVMGCMGLIGMLFGRKQTGVNSLSFTAALLAAFNPFLLLDIGFQLSFMATLGLILFSDPITSLFEKWFAKEENNHQLVGFWKILIQDYLSPLLAAQLIVTPLLIYYFHQFSLVSMPANLLIAPLQPPIMIFGGLSVLVSYVIFPLGKLISFVAWGFTALTIRIVVAFNALPANTLQLAQISIFSVLVFYLLLFGLWFGIKRKKLNLSKLTPVFITTALGIFALLIWQVNMTKADGNLYLHFLDLTTGDGILIQTPNGNRVLINGGKYEVNLSNSLYPTLPITQHTIDAIVVANQTKDQIGALEDFIQSNQTPLVFWQTEPTTSFANNALSTITTYGTEINYPQPNQKIEIDQAVTIEFLSQSNSGSMLLIQYQKLNVLLCFDTLSSCLETDTSLASLPQVFYIFSQTEFDSEELQTFQNYQLQSQNANRVFLINQAPWQETKGNSVFLKEEKEFELLTDGESMWFQAQ